MLNYIWLDDKSPILNQLPNGFKSAAILLHPITQMPSDWIEENSKNAEKDEKVYPSDEELLKLGKQVRWLRVMHETNLNNLNELAFALKTAFFILNKQYAREDLAKKLKINIKQDVYYPSEDYTSIFLVRDLLKILCSKGAKYLSYSHPLLENHGVLEIEKITPFYVGELALKELIITDENMDFAFMNVYDSFITIFMTRDEKIDEIVNRMG